MRTSFPGKSALQIHVGATSRQAHVDRKDFSLQHGSLSSVLAGESRTYSNGRTRLAAEQPATLERYDYTTIAPPIGGTIKRVADILIAVTAVVLLSPLMLIIFGLIRFTSGAPVIFAHTRIGYDAKPFKCYKFRTMDCNASEILTGHLASNSAAAQEWRQHRKLYRDPRVTPLGHFLRKSSLDELPQLFNVLRGEMSCVGPRPVPADELLQYRDASEEYVKARPGMTGNWQVNGRNKLDYTERVALDCDYIRNWSFWRDIVILCKTVFVVVNFDETS